jgi:hypothetical protein
MSSHISAPGGITKVGPCVTARASRALTHVAVVKNDILYLYGGIETFNVPNLTVKSENNTLGYSKYRFV